MLSGPLPVALRLQYDAQAVRAAQLLGTTRSAEDDGVGAINFTCEESQTYSHGMTYLHYRPKVA